MPSCTKAGLAGFLIVVLGSSRGKSLLKGKLEVSIHLTWNLSVYDKAVYLEEMRSKDRMFQIPKRHLKKCILELRCFSKFKKFWLLQNWNVLFQFQDFQREKSRLIFFSEIKGRVTMLRLFKELSS